MCVIFICFCVCSLYVRRKKKDHLFYTSWKSKKETVSFLFVRILCTLHVRCVHVCVYVCATHREIYSGCVYVKLCLRGVPSCICEYLCVDLSVYGGVCACWYVTYSCGNMSIYITAINHTEESRLFFVISLSPFTS